MDSGPSTLHLITPTDPVLDKFLVPCKLAMCGTSQPISHAHGLHSHGCGCLLQVCAQPPSFSPGEPKVCFSGKAGEAQTPSVLTGVALDLCKLADWSPLVPGAVVDSCHRQVQHGSFQDAFLKLPSVLPTCWQVAVCPVGFWGWGLMLFSQRCPPSGDSSFWPLLMLQWSLWKPCHLLVH